MIQWGGVSMLIKVKVLKDFFDFGKTKLYICIYGYN